MAAAGARLGSVALRLDQEGSRMAKPVRKALLVLDVVAHDCEPVDKGSMAPTEQFALQLARELATASPDHAKYLHARHDDDVG